jgi:anaerobic selenocysteine-containing dehydrogenase
LLVLQRITNMNTATQTHFRTCNLCEAMCGLEIKYQGREVLSIAGDKNDPFSRGHICPKAYALKDIYEDPNRLRKPIKRSPEGWVEISWDEAFAEVSNQLLRIRAQHGANAIGVYAGNPSVHNSGTFMTAPGLVKAIGTRNFFSATSVDQLPHHFASWLVYGHPMLMPVPDIDHTDYWIILGGNPIASNGSIMTAPDVANRLRAIQQRGGKVVTIDPRHTETSAKASEHLFIRPGTDAYLLLSMIQVLFAEGLVRPGHLADFCDGIEDFEHLSALYTPEAVSHLTGIAPEAVRRLTREFAAAPRAALYGRVGVSTQAYGGICLWLIQVINILTGHLDQPGGMMFTSPALDFLAGSKPYTRYNRYQSRVRQRPEFMGELPVSCLAEEILTPGDGQIRALLTSCGNPVLSTPNGTQLDEALASLDFMVSVDIYINETTRHAHLILPPATGLETAHYDLTFHFLAIRNTAKYSQPLFEKAPGAKYDWEIFEELRLRMENPHTPPAAKDLQNPETKLDLGLRFGPYGSSGLSLQQLKDTPHGVDLGPLKSSLPDRLLTANRRINLAPEMLVQDLGRLAEQLNQTQTLDFRLISRRHLRDNNSWMHNSAKLMKGKNRCTLLIHPQDAQRVGLQDGQLASVASRVGQVQVAAEITEHIMPGVVCLPHGYGHGRKGVQLDVATQHAGVSINDLTDETVLDTLTGNAVFNGVPVSVKALP